MEKKSGFKNIFSKRNLKYGSNSIILIVAVVVIAVLVNVLVGMGNFKLDLTPNKLFSLSDVSKNELKGLKQEVQIIGLFDDGKVGSGDDMKQVTEVLGLYSKYSNVKISYVDPDKNPGIIKQLDPDNTMNLQKNDFVVQSKVNGQMKKRVLTYYDLFELQTDQNTGSYNKTGSTAEQGFTGAIKYVSSQNTPVVYFTEGHNEMDINSDYSDLKTFIERNNFVTKKINLLTVKNVPEDAALVIVASPKSDITSAEKDILATYLKAGGKAAFLFDYLENDPSYDQFNSLLSGYNVAVNYDKVKENDESRTQPDDPYTIRYDAVSNDIIQQNFSTWIGNSRSLSILKNTKEYIKTTSLISTSENAVGEMISKSRGEDLKGAQDIAVAAENKGGTETSKILVIGNASFIGNASAQKFGDYYYQNMGFVLQSLNWMVDKQEEIIVPTKNYEVNQIAISQLQSSVMGVVLVIVFPLLILGTGLAVFLRRRHL